MITYNTIFITVCIGYVILYCKLNIKIFKRFCSPIKDALKVGGNGELMLMIVFDCWYSFLFNNLLISDCKER